MRRAKEIATKNQEMKIMTKNLGIKKVQQSGNHGISSLRKNQKVSLVNIWQASMRIAKAITKKIASKCWLSCRFLWRKGTNVKDSFNRSENDKINDLFPFTSFLTHENHIQFQENRLFQYKENASICSI